MDNLDFSSLKIMLVEDEKRAAEHLHSILKLYFEHITLAFNGCEAIEHIKKKMVDIIIMDIKMPCMDGLKVIEEIQKLKKSPAIIITSAYSQSEYLLDAIDKHVHSYLVKPINIEKLVEKIKEASLLLNHHSNKHAILSKREYEIFIYLAQGFSLKETAEQFGISQKTVSTYKKRIFEKMNFHSLSELVRYALLNNLI